jgi:hypothetical protein
LESAQIENRTTCPKPNVVPKKPGPKKRGDAQPAAAGGG